MADERDIIRARLGLAPLTATPTVSAVDERTQTAAKTLTPAQLQARQAQAEAATAQQEAAAALTAAKANAAKLATELGAKIDPLTGKIDVTTIPKTPSGKTVTSVTYEGTGKNRIKITKYSDGSETREPAPEIAGGGGPKAIGTETDPVTGDVYTLYDDGSKVLLFKGTKAADAALAAQQKAAAEAEAKRKAGQSAYDLLLAEFDRYGLGALVEPLKGFITEGLSPAEFTLRLRQTDAYKKRFAANEQRIKAGLRALSEAEYVTLEDQYQDVMRRYGLPQSYYAKGEMGVQPGFEKFIGGDVSPVELEDRIQTAQNRVINAAPEISKALREFYPDITNGDILAYALDPNQAISTIKRKVTAAEIGAGAMIAGLSTGLTRAEELQRYGVTGEQARQGFQTISSILPRATTLGDIYAKSGLGPYTQTTAEAEVFGTPGATEAQRKRQQLTQLEQAQFSGQVGAAGSALGRERAGQF